MARLSFVILLVVSLVVCAFAQEDEKYDDKYDHLDIDEYLKNDRLRTQYFKCFMDTGPCVTPDALFFKQHYPEAVVTKCRKCTERQKEAFEKVAVWYHDNEPESWDAVVRKAVNDFQARAAARKLKEQQNAQAQKS